MFKKTKKFLTAILIISIIFNISGCSFYKKTNSGKVNLKWYMNLTDESENPYKIKGDGEIVAVALEDQYSDDFAIVRDGQIYLNVNTVIEYIDKRFYFAKKDKLVMFTDANNIYETALSGNQINEETVDYTTCFTERKKCYVNINFVKKFVDFKYELQKGDKKTPAKVFLSYTSGKKKAMTVSDDIEMRTGPDYQNLIVTTVKEDSKVTIIEDKKNWKKVRTNDGFIGYLPDSEMEDEKTEKQEFKDNSGEYTHILYDDKISLAWNQVTNIYANNNISELLKNVQGLNVISPTWFTIADKNGTINSFASKSYVIKAKRSGLYVWALFSDLNEKGKKYMAHVLQYKALRRNVINQLIYQVEQNEIDGINIDFEHIAQESGCDYLQFLRELSIECRSRQIVLSIDNYVPVSGNGYYDRAQQGMLADYVIVMSYDEHATSVDGAGSVSSMTYTEDGIKNTIDEVGDAKRVINGMPFYTTIWTETPVEFSDGSGTYYDDSTNGGYYLTSQDVSMDVAKKLCKKAGAEATYDETTGQNYVSFQNGNDFVQIWLEDKTSVTARLDLMKKYEIGGAAYWCLGQESDSIWQIVEDYFE